VSADESQKMSGLATEDDVDDLEHEKIFVQGGYDMRQEIRKGE